MSGSLFTGRPAGRPVGVWEVLGVAIEARRHAPPPDRGARELADRLWRCRGGDLDQAERLPDFDAADVALREARLADQRADEILRRRAVLLSDVHEDLHAPGVGDRGWGDLFPLPPSPFLKQRSEEHTSELQSQSNLVCRLLLEKKKRQIGDCAGELSAPSHTSS